MNINYNLLAEAIYYYKQEGYEMIEVPWMVYPQASLATNPPEGGIFVLEDGRHLVGSAEQGFIQIMHELEADKKYMAVSPCFRRGDNRDEYHQETFMKLELFSFSHIGLPSYGQYSFEQFKKYSDRKHRALYTHSTSAGKVFEKLGISLSNLYYNTEGLNHALTTQDTHVNIDIDVVLNHEYNPVYGHVMPADKLEIGSYGYRVVGEIYMQYGTGLALPRFEQALKGQYIES